MALSGRCSGQVVFTVGVLLLAVICLANADDCSEQRFRQCNFVIQHELDRRNVGHQEVEYHCRSLRQGIDCLVRHMTMCPFSTEDRSTTGDMIWKVRKYLQSVCDSSGGGWWQKQCYQLDEIRHCERLYPLDVKSVVRANCQTFERFRTCVTDVVNRRCNTEDRYILGTYLMDKGQEMVWKCPVGGSSTRLGGFGGGGGYSDRYQDLAPASIISPSDLTGCNNRASLEMRTCYDSYLRDREEASSYGDGNERTKRSCCATHSYRRCVRNAISNYCASLDPREADRMVTTSSEEEYMCRDHWLYTCSFAERRASVSFILLLTMLIGRLLLAK